MSTKQRALNESMLRQIRQFIAGAVLFNQKVADENGLRLTDMQCMGVLELLGPSTPGKLAEQKLKKFQAYYDRITEQTVAVFEETPEAELEAVERFFARINAIRVERGPLE